MAREITKEIASEKELLETLKSLSAEDGAWVFAVKPFSHEVTFIKFQNPSSVPDSFHDLTKNTMGYQGCVRGFTNGAKNRERNRGLGSR